MKTVLRLFSIALLVLSAACSLQNKKGEGIKVRLMKSQQTAARDLKRMLQSSSFLPVAATIDGIEDLTCFAVNARGDAIPTETHCNGHLIEGEFDGPFSGIDSNFELFIPQDEGQIFEAFGSRGGCSEDDEDFDDDQTIYKIGTVIANTVTTKEINIPVAFNPALGFACSTEPYLVFSDTFDYSDTSLSANLNWTGGGCNPGNDLPLVGSDRIDAAIISGNNCAASVDRIDFSRTYTSVSARLFADTNINFSGGTPVEVALGVTDGGVSASASGFGCKIQYPTDAIPTDVKITLGTFTSNYDPTSGSVTGVLDLLALGGDGDIDFTCEIQRTSPQNYEIRAQVYDHDSGTLLTEFSAPSFSLPAAEDSDRVFMRIDGHGSNFFGTNGFMDDFILKQSDFEQF